MDSFLCMHHVGLIVIKISLLRLALFNVNNILLKCLLSKITYAAMIYTLLRKFPGLLQFDVGSKINTNLNQEKTQIYFKQNTRMYIFIYS